MNSAPDLQPSTDNTVTTDEPDLFENLPLMRERLTKLFKFLKAYSDLRYPPVRDIDQQPGTIWLGKLPAHPAVELFRDTPKTEEVFEDNDIVLRLQRPTTSPCPE